MTGFVSFVGSGPGDPELLTLKAVDRLGKADAILFDDLSSGPILEHARADADLVGVGKRAGRASPRQDHVSRLLVDYAQTGQHVVRLKSGDSGLFGRLEEEQRWRGGQLSPLELCAYGLRSGPHLARLTRAHVLRSGALRRPLLFLHHSVAAQPHFW